MPTPGIAHLARFAQTLDIQGLKHGLQAEPRNSKLEQTDKNGMSLLHIMIMSLFTSKAGDVSRAYQWYNASTTIFRDTATQLQADRMQVGFSCLTSSPSSLQYGLARLEIHPDIRLFSQPLLETILHRAPTLATKANIYGVTPLHMSASLNLHKFLPYLLANGANPSAT